MRKLKVSIAGIVVCCTPCVPGAALAQDPGVHFDSGSPAGKEYAIPLAEGRAEAAGTTNQRAAANTPFGVGITPPGGGGGPSGRPGGGGPAGSGTAGGDGARGRDGGADGSRAGREAGERADGRALVVDKRAVSNAEAPVDTTVRTMGLAFGVLLASFLVALLLWWRREQPAG